MGRGILSGLVWGGVTGGAVVSVLSLYAPLPDTSKAMVEAKTKIAEPVVEPEPEVPVEPEPKVEPAEETAVQEPAIEEPEPETAAETEQQSEVAPEVVIETVEPEEVVAVEPAPDAQIEAPGTAVNQTDSDDNAQTTVPDTDQAVAPSQATPLTGADAETPVAELETPQTPVRPSVVSDAPTAPEAADAPKLASLSDAATPSPVKPTEPSLPQVDAAPSASGDTAPRVAVVAPQPESEPVLTTPVSADTPIKLPVPKIENPVAGVVTNRLPSVTTAEPETAEETTEKASTEQVDGAAAPLDASAVGALTAYAAEVEGDVTDALFSIILIDDGSADVARSELINLDVPFSVAIDPSNPTAQSVAAEYRAAGIEVLAMLSDLPTAAEPGDVAVAVEGYFGVLNEAIAVMDPLDARIQSNRSLLQPVLGAIRDTGHGLVTYDRGLNTAQQAARREGIAAATVFRVLDADNEEGPKIKRYLGRAAFNASKDGTVVVVGHGRSETVKAVLEWALDEKGGELSIVPVSRVMQTGLGSN